MDSWLPKIPSVALDDSSRIAKAQSERDEWKKLYEELRDENANAAALRERDELVAAISGELENTKRALRNAAAESDARLKDAKTKAKELIQKKMILADEEKEVLKQTLNEREFEAQELRDSLNKREQQISEAEELRGQISELTTRFSDSQQTVQSLKGKIEEMKCNETLNQVSAGDTTVVEDLRQEIQASTQALLEHRSLAEQYQIQLQSKQTEIDSLTVGVSNKRSLVDDLTTQLKENEQQANSRDLALGQVQQFAQAREQELLAELQKLKDSSVTILADNENASGDAEAQATITRLKKESSDIAEKLKVAEEKDNPLVAQLNDEILSLNEKLNACRSSSSDDSASDDLKRLMIENRDLVERLSTVEADSSSTVAQLQRENQKLTDQLGDAEATVEHAVADLTATNSSYQALKLQMEQSEGSLVSRAEVEERLAKALAIQEEQNQQNSELATKHEDITRRIEALKTDMVSREKFSKLETELEETRAKLEDAVNGNAAQNSARNETDKQLRQEEQENLLRLSQELEECRQELEKQKSLVATLEEQRSNQTSSPDGDRVRSRMADLEGQLAAKNAELNKTKEKAKIYLKEINGEKTKLQEKMDKGLAEAKVRLEEADGRANAKSKQALTVSRELEGTLSLVMEKQIAIDTLEQQISSERRNSEDALDQVVAIQKEFLIYKEKARKALAERDALISVSDSAVENATMKLRSQINTLTTELNAAKTENRRIPDLEDSLRKQTDAVEMGARALTAARSESVTGQNDSRKLIELEYTIADLQNDLAKCQNRALEAESQCASMTVRLEISQKTIKGLQDEIVRLQAGHATAVGLKAAEIETLLAQLRDSNASTKAAQRTAAAAAMAFDPSSHSPGPVMRMQSSSSSANQVGMDDFVLPNPSESDLNHEEMTMLRAELSRVRDRLLETQKTQTHREDQVGLLKRELRELDSLYKAAQNLKEGIPFEYLKNAVSQFLETDDLETMLPVFKTILSFSPEEVDRIRARRRKRGSDKPSGSIFGLGFLGGGS